MFKVKMIRILDDPASSRYAKFTAPSWSDFDFSFYDAVKPATLQDQRGLQFSDVKAGGKPWTDTEKACFYSHYNLWKECATRQDGLPYLILEHDALLVDTSQVFFDPRFQVVYFGQHAMEAVMYTPLTAKKLVQSTQGVLIDRGPMSYLDRFLGIYSKQSEHGVPHARLLGPSAPVRSVIDPKLGTTIDHGDERSSVSYRVTRGDERNLFFVTDLSNI